MIIIKLMGGLGNQMFQYALGRNLSLIHNTPFKVDYSYLKVPNQSQRTLRVGNYRTILEEVTDKEIASYTSTFQKILDKIRSNKKMIVEKSNILTRTFYSKMTDIFMDIGMTRNTSKQT